MSNPVSGPPVKGNLTDTYLPGLLFQLHRRAFTGTLHARNGPTGKSVYFRDGRILSAASNHDQDRLSSLLLREGILSPEQMEMAREKLRPGTSLGRSLVELGFVSRSQLMETARNQVRGILMSLFDWETGQYEVLENQIPSSVPRLKMETGPLLFETLMGSSNRQAVLKNLGGMDRRFRRNTEGEITRRGFSFPREAETVFSLADGTRKVADICAETRVDDFTTAKILCAGFHLGFLESVPEEASKPPIPEPGPVETREPAPKPGTGTLPVGAGIPAREKTLDPVRRETPLEATDEISLTDPQEGDLAGTEGPFHGYVDTAGGEPEKKRFRPPWGGGRSWRPRWVAIGGLLVASGLVVLALVLRSAGGPPEPAARGQEQTPRVAPVASPEQPGPADRALEPEDPTAEGTVTPPPRESVPATTEILPRPVSRMTPRESTPPETATPVPAALPPSGPSLVQARRALLSREFAAAAESFRSALTESPPGAFTLQLLVACRPETIEGILPPPEDFFLLRFPYRGKDCFRACWGTFPDKASALMARKKLPSGLPKLPDLPFPISVSRVLSQAGSIEAPRP